MEGKEMELVSLSTAATNLKIATTADTLRDSSDTSFERDAVKETKALVSELCRHFYTLGWVSGTGGSVTIKVHEENILKSHQLIIMSPSGVQKERMVPEDMHVLSSDGFILLRPPPKPYPHNPPKCTDCAALFLKIYDMRNAGAVIHSHGIESCIVTMINPFSKEFHMTHMEMIKGIQGHGYNDKLVVPIVENASHEGELVESVTEAIRAYPKSNAILVRNHGVFIWGDTWINAKTQAECYHYLFAASIKLHRLGLNCSFHSSVGNIYVSRRLARNVPKPRPLDLDCVSEPSQRFILLDMAGTTTPLSFFASGHYSSANSIPTKHAASYKNAETIELIGIVFDDVPEALRRWHASGIKVYIYSYHSREAQHRLFGKSNYGDLRKYLCGYFDTTVGCKMESQSYIEISQTVGVVEPSDMLFVTDTLQEALAARAAGLEIVISIRPGNEPLQGNHGLRTIESLLEIS